MLNLQKTNVRKSGNRRENIRTACNERMSAPTGFMSSSSSKPEGMPFPYSTKCAFASVYMMRDSETCPSIAEESVYYIQVHNVEGKREPFPVIILRPNSPPERTVLRVTTHSAIILRESMTSASSFSNSLKASAAVANPLRQLLRRAEIYMTQGNVRQKLVKIIIFFKLTSPHHTSLYFLLVTWCR